MNFFTQGFLFSRTEFRINNNKTSFKVTVFFFTRKCTLVINSFISENSVSAKREKKAVPEEKFIGHSIRFWWSSFFYIKVAYVFFPHFCVFCFFFFSTEKFKGHSFIRFLRRKKTWKKIAFSFIHSIFLINAQKRTFPGK